MTTQEILDRETALANYINWLRMCEAKLQDRDRAIWFTPADSTPRMNGMKLRESMTLSEA